MIQTAVMIQHRLQLEHVLADALDPAFSEVPEIVAFIPL